MDESLIALRLRSVAQFFNTMDPSPFRDSDLAPEAEAYICDAAQDLPHKAPIAIEIHLPPAEAAGPAATDLPGAVSAYFSRRARDEANEIRALFRSGRRALAIGLLVLSVCMGLALAATTLLADNGVSQIVHESFVIIGWVAIWRPAEIFLYDWLPISKRRTLFRRLAQARVTVKIRQDAPAA